MAVLGMRGSGSYASPDERPKNYREMILLLYPNAKAPLTAMLSKLKDEDTDDASFKIFTKDVPAQVSNATASFTSGATSITVGDGTIYKVGHAILDVLTLEVMWVTGVAGAVLTVARGKGTSAFASSGSADPLLIVGSHHEEGAGVPTAIAYNPSVVENFTQIFRNSLNITNTAKMTRLRTGDAIAEARRESLELHAIEMEKAFLFGAKLEDTGGSQPNRTTGGLNSFLSTNVQDFAGSVTIDSWENFLEAAFRYGSSEKLCLLGGRALNVLNKIARAYGTVNITPQAETYGMYMLTWITPFGVLQLKLHPLLSIDSTFTSWGFIIDPAHIVYRYLKGRDTQYLENRQAPGDDAQIDEWLGECGLELQHEKVHGVFKNASAFAA